MADLHMLGKITKEQSDFFFDLPHLFYVGSVEKGDDDNYVSFKRGSNALESAMFLWDLVNPEVRKKYHEFLKNEIEVERNHLNSGGYLISIEQIKKILEFIDDIDEKVQKFVDSEGCILPQYLNYVEEKIYLPILENGDRDRNILKGDLASTEMIKLFLQKAIELNHPLSI